MAATEGIGGEAGRDGVRLASFSARTHAARAVEEIKARPAAAASVGLILLIEAAGYGLDPEARRALQIFAVAFIGWTWTSLDDAFVALVAALAMAVFVMEEPDELFEALGSELIWLMLASFLLAAAFQATGLAQRLAGFALDRARTTRGAFHALAAVIFATAFLTPSTSGRAALMVPIFEAAGARATSAARKGLALLFPTAILLSAFASLTGAGAHVLAADMLDEVSDEKIGYLEWALYGAPFAAACTFLAAEAILRLFVPKGDRRAAIEISRAAPAERHDRAGVVLAIAGLVLLGWATKPLHGVDDTLVALAGACAAVAPGVGGVGFDKAVRGVEWPLMLFMAATVAIAEGLAESGLVKALADSVFAPLGDLGLPPLAWLLAIATFGMLSHLLIHSRTARVAILLPPTLAAAKAAGVEPLAATLTLVASTGFCQLLTVSAKPVALFSALPGGTFEPRALVRLGLVLMPIQLALIALFAGVVWPLLGLDLAD